MNAANVLLGMLTQPNKSIYALCTQFQQTFSDKKEQFLQLLAICSLIKENQLNAHERITCFCVMCALYSGENLHQNPVFTVFYEGLLMALASDDTVERNLFVHFFEPESKPKEVGTRTRLIFI